MFRAASHRQCRLGLEHLPMCSTASNTSSITVGRGEKVGGKPNAALDMHSTMVPTHVYKRLRTP